MKTRVFFVLVSVLAVLAPFPAGLAQQQVAQTALLAPQTRLEQFLATPGQLLVKDFFRVEDRLTRMTMQAMVVTSVGPQPVPVRMLGLRIDVRDRATQNERFSTSYLDFEEMQPLSTALASMTSLAGKWVGALQEPNVTEVEFASVSGFSIGFRQDWQTQRAFASSGFLDPLRVPIELDDLIKAKYMVDQALTILQKK